MDDVRNQLELTNEISEAISNPAGMGIDVRCRLGDFSATPLTRALSPCGTDRRPGPCG